MLSNRKRSIHQYKKNNAFTPKQMAVNSRTGIKLTNPTEILGRWKEYGEEHFQKNDNESEIQTIDLHEVDKKPSPLLPEAETAIRDLHSGKASGLDNIPAELVKTTGPTAVKVLHMLCVKIWGIWSQEWKQQGLVMHYKNGNRLQKKIFRELPEEQAGF